MLSSRYKLTTHSQVADLFGNFDIVDQSTTGDTRSGRSNMELDVTTGATTTTLPLKALDISQDPDNDDVASANTNVMVVIQNHIAGVKSAWLGIRRLIRWLFHAHN